MRKFKRARLATAASLLLCAGVVGGAEDIASAAGQQNCQAIDGCVYQNTGQGGKVYGTNVNYTNLGVLTYSDTSSVANNVRSWKFTANPTYISFCLYNFTGYIGSLNSGNNVGKSGNVSQGAESSRFLIQPAC